MCFYNNTHTRARSRRHGRRRSGVGCVSVCVSHISDLDICTNIVPAGVWWDEKENATNLDFGADNFVCRRKATSLIDFALRHNESDPTVKPEYLFGSYCEILGNLLMDSVRVDISHKSRNILSGL